MKKYLWGTMMIMFCMFIIENTFAQDMVIESLTGPVTQKEIAAYKANMKNLTLPTTNKGNALVYGGGGKNLEAMGQMYEVTEDIEILNRMIQFADNALASRNDLALGKKDTIWTGRIEPVWPNYSSHSPRGWQYAGTENGDVISHIAYCAQTILEHPSVWNLTVPVGDPYGFGATYLDRAKKYVNECLYTMDTYIIKYHVRSNYQLQHPDDPLYRAIDARHDKDAGGSAPWNQQTMLTGAFLRLSRCMEILKINPDKIVYYDKVVKTSIDWFVSELHSYQQNGKNYYKWSYASGDKNLRYMEDVGHGGYDITGIHRAYMSGKYGVSNEVMVGLANTLMDIIMEPFPEETRFKSYVDGSKGDSATTARIGGTYFYLCPFRSDIFQPLGTFQIGDRGLGDPLIVSCILWIKDKNYKNLWSGIEYKAVTIPGTIEAERYNLGGEGSGYHDVDAGNSGNLFRNDDVGIVAVAGSSFNYSVGSTKAGEWLNYAVNVNAAGSYVIKAKVSSASANNKIRVEVDGNVIGTVTVPNSGQNYKEVTIGSATLTSGVKQVRLYFETGNVNVDNIVISSGTITNQPPVVSIVTPVNNATFAAGTNVYVKATASDSDGSIAKIDLYNGITFVATEKKAPYEWNISGLAAGTYVLKAIATDNGGAQTTAAVVTIIVQAANAAPTVSITSPANNASSTAPANITINANAADSDGSITKVEFYNGSTKLGEDATSPYSFAWNNVAVGTYSLTAKAIDDKGASTNSATITVTVTNPANVSPTVSITSPANNASFTAPASITINANASDSDGSVSKVEFFNGTIKLGEDATSPYSFAWNNVVAGTYSITAKATDDKGAVATSTIVSVTVNAAANTCSSIPQYAENAGYVSGSKVQNAGGIFQCKPYPYTGWCNGAAWAYAPGTGSYWTDAWTQIGTCTAARQASQNNLTGLNIFPNPADNYIMIEFGQSGFSDAEVSIENIYGTVLIHQMNVNDNSQINIANLSSGIYVIRILQNESELVYKFIKR